MISVLPATHETASYVVLEGINLGNRFMTTNRPEESEDSMCRSAKGELWYRILGYAHTHEEASMLIYETRDPDELAMREKRALIGYAMKTLAEMAKMQADREDVEIFGHL